MGRGGGFEDCDERGAERSSGLKAALDEESVKLRLVPFTSAQARHRHLDVGGGRGGVSGRPGY
jgi:hypothetical protein